MDRQGLLCALALAALLFMEGARAQTILCTDDLDADRVNRNLTVVGFCELEDVEIRGNVRVLAGASLVARDVSIGGNLIADRALAVEISSSVIDGNVELEQLTGVSSVLSRTEIDGRVVIERNVSRIELVSNDIRGNVDVVLNTGGVELTANRIRGKLECERNQPPPLLLENRVEREAEGQCAEPAPAPPPAPSPTPQPSPSPQPSPTPQPSPQPQPGPSQPSPSPAPVPTPTPTPEPPSTTSSFVPQPEGGGGGAAGVLEIALLPLLLLGRCRRALSSRSRGAAG